MQKVSNCSFLEQQYLLDFILLLFLLQAMEAKAKETVPSKVVATMAMEVGYFNSVLLWKAHIQ